MRKGRASADAQISASLRPPAADASRETASNFFLLRALGSGLLTAGAALAAASAECFRSGERLAAVGTDSDPDGSGPSWSIGLPAAAP